MRRDRLQAAVGRFGNARVDAAGGEVADIAHAILTDRKCGGASAIRSLARFRRRVDAPVLPVVSEQLGRVLRTFRAIAAAHRIGRTVLVASPADSLGMGWIDGKFFSHFRVPGKVRTQ